jgi:hypothetical protein
MQHCTYLAVGLKHNPTLLYTSSDFKSSPRFSSGIFCLGIEPFAKGSLVGLILVD